MRKHFALLFLLLLAACGTAPALPDSAAPQEPPPEAEPASTSASGAAVTPASTAAEASIVRDRDWTKGAEDPLVTIIEYGDFQ